MTEPLPDTDRRTLGRAAVARAKELMADKEAVALGPGLGQGEEVTEFVRAVIAASSAPMVIDADGLNAVATDPEMVKARQAPIIVTPHPGEMSRLLKRPTAQVQADRLSAALEFAKSYGVITVLKGAHTVIATPEGQAFIVLSGNPGMATAGMGDVLTGVIGSLLGQGYDPGRAAVLGVYLHGRAGDLAAKDLGEVGLIASDLIQRLPRTLSELKVEV
jgi:NAD(P)H-hydrate epimerase